MIKGITFDLDGVYFINGKANFIKKLVKLGVPEEKAVLVFFKSDQMNQRYKTGQISDEEYWSWAMREWELDLSVKEVTELLINSYKVNQPVANFVNKVKKAGYKTLICSNNFPARINGLQKRFGFLDNFDTAVFSYQARATKPSEKIFRELVSRSGLKPEEITFADDNQDNLTGAKTIGIQAFYFQGFERFVEKLTKLGVYL